MSRQFFIKSTLEPWPHTICDKCGLIIKDVQDGSMYWNPNGNAHHRNICRNCFDVFSHKQEEGRKKWRDKFAKLETGVSEPCPK